MHANIFSTIKQVLKILSVNEKLVIKNKELVSISDKAISTPVGDISKQLFQHKSKLKNQFVKIELLQKFVDELTHNNALIRINHLGFCYKVASQEQERERLKKLLKNSSMHLYAEPSNDEAMWYFIGDTDNWEDSMLELLPLEKTNDKWVDYYLPHIQIDIDTTLSEKEIKSFIKSTFGKSVYPFSIAIDGIVYIVRNRLGTIDGVNITLDLATNSRNVKAHRQKSLQRIDY